MWHHPYAFAVLAQMAHLASSIEAGQEQRGFANAQFPRVVPKLFAVGQGHQVVHKAGLGRAGDRGDLLPWVIHTPAVAHVQFQRGQAAKQTWLGWQA
ncbi:hypothetical protein CSC81_17240, partial [Tenacibaculum discolor]